MRRYRVWAVLSLVPAVALWVTGCGDKQDTPKAGGPSSGGSKVGVAAAIAANVATSTASASLPGTVSVTVATGCQ